MLKGQFGRGRVAGHKKGMNKLEARYAAYLDMLKKAGEVASYSFESVTLKLAERTTYTPDFMVMYADGRIELHETKGFMREDANVKLKTAAAMFPMFPFILVKEDHGCWKTQEIPCGYVPDKEKTPC